MICRAAVPENADGYVHDMHNKTQVASGHRALQSSSSEIDGCLPWIDLQSEYADFQLAEQLHYTDDTANSIEVGGFVYRTLDNCPADASPGTCTGTGQTGSDGTDTPIALPAGWSIAPYSATAKDAVCAYSWGASTVVFDDGVPFATGGDGTASGTDQLVQTTLPTYALVGSGSCRADNDVTPDFYVGIGTQDCAAVCGTDSNCIGYDIRSNEEDTCVFWWTDGAPPPTFEWMCWDGQRGGRDRYGDDNSRESERDCSNYGFADAAACNARCALVENCIWANYDSNPRRSPSGSCAFGRADGFCEMKDDPDRDVRSWRSSGSVCKKPYGAAVTDQTAGGNIITASDGSSNAVQCYAKDGGAATAYSSQDGASRVMIRKPALPQTDWADIQSSKLECWNGGAPTVDLSGAAAVQFSDASASVDAGVVTVSFTAQWLWDAQSLDASTRLRVLLPTDGEQSNCFLEVALSAWYGNSYLAVYGPSDNIAGDGFAYFDGADMFISEELYAVSLSVNLGSMASVTAASANSDYMAKWSLCFSGCTDAQDAELNGFTCEQLAAGPSCDIPANAFDVAAPASSVADLCPVQCGTCGRKEPNCCGSALTAPHSAPCWQSSEL
eukprot:COSAG02_NODE_796_length_17128_cov_176.587586_1_plen_612_part_10